MNVNLKYTIKYSSLILLIIAASVLLATPSLVFAQTDDTTPQSIQGYVIAGLSFIIAGLYYATSGFIKKFARSLHGDTTVKIDYNRLARTTLLGVALGVVTFIAADYNGEELHITTTHEFLVQVSLNLAAVLTIDKLILGGYSKSKSFFHNATDSLILIPEPIKIRYSICLGFGVNLNN